MKLPLLPSSRRARLAAGLVAILAVAGAVFFYERSGGLSAPSLLARLPTEDATVVSVDFEALRRGGILGLLSGSVVDEEPEYKTFVAKTGFDYKRDLDRALVSFHPSGIYFLVRGRFYWKKLEDYAREQGGGCFNGLCRMPGSTAARKISFFPLRRNVMALAVSTDDWAATRLSEPQKAGRTIPIAPQPVWLAFPPAALRKSDSFPAGTQLFAKAMQEAENATLSFDAQGQAFEAQLEVLCRDAHEASILAEQFKRMTALLVELIAKEKQKPNPRDLSGVLTAGVFRQEDRRVLGRWPLERVFLENLAGKAR